MRVIATLTVGEKEIGIEGDGPIFGNPDYKKGVDARLRDIGFWLENWRYAGNRGPNNKTGKVFIPWTSALYIEELC